MLNAKIKYNMTSRGTTECNIIVYKLAEKRVAAVAVTAAKEEKEEEEGGGGGGEGGGGAEENRCYVVQGALNN